MTSTVAFRQGAIELLILKALSWGPLHGFSIARWVQCSANDALSLEEGSLYPALRRMEEKDWVVSEWGISEHNRRAKYYRLTARGRTQLVHETQEWWRYVDAVAQVLRTTARPVLA